MIECEEHSGDLFTSALEKHLTVQASTQRVRWTTILTDNSVLRLPAPTKEKCRTTIAHLISQVSGPNRHQKSVPMTCNDNLLAYCTNEKDDKSDGNPHAKVTFRLSKKLFSTKGHSITLNGVQEVSSLEFRSAYSNLLAIVDSSGTLHLGTVSSSVTSLENLSFEGFERLEFPQEFEYDSFRDVKYQLSWIPCIYKLSDSCRSYGKTKVPENLGDMLVMYGDNGCCVVVKFDTNETKKLEESLSGVFSPATILYFEHLESMAITSANISPDGVYMSTSSINGRLCIWKLDQCDGLIKAGSVEPRKEVIPFDGEPVIMHHWCDMQLFGSHTETSYWSTVVVMSASNKIRLLDAKSNFSCLQTLSLEQECCVVERLILKPLNQSFGPLIVLHTNTNFIVILNASIRTEGVDPVTQRITTSSPFISSVTAVPIHFEISNIYMYPSTLLKDRFAFKEGFFWDNTSLGVLRLFASSTNGKLYDMKITLQEIKYRGRDIWPNPSSGQIGDEGRNRSIFDPFSEDVLASVNDAGNSLYSALYETANSGSITESKKDYSGIVDCEQLENDSETKKDYSEIVDCEQLEKEVQALPVTTSNKRSHNLLENSFSPSIPLPKTPIPIINPPKKNKPSANLSFSERPKEQQQSRGSKDKKSPSHGDKQSSELTLILQKLTTLETRLEKALATFSDNRNSENLIDRLSQNIKIMLLSQMSQLADTVTLSVTEKLEQRLRSAFVDVNNAFNIGTQQYLKALQDHLNHFKETATANDSKRYPRSAFSEASEALVNKVGQIEKGFSLMLTKRMSQLKNELLHQLMGSFSDLHTQQTNTIVSTIETCIASKAGSMLTDDESMIEPRYHPSDLAVRVRHLANIGKLVPALALALKYKDTNLVNELCLNNDPSLLLKASTSSLSTPLLYRLALMMSRDLADESQLKIEYIREVLMALDVSTHKGDDDFIACLTQLISNLDSHLPSCEKRDQQMIRMLILISERFLQ